MFEEDWGKTGFLSRLVLFSSKEKVNKAKPVKSVTFSPKHNFILTKMSLFGDGNLQSKNWKKEKNENYVIYLSFTWDYQQG